MEQLENVGRIVAIIDKRKREVVNHTVEADVYLDSIVHNMENFYMGIEEIFKSIAVFTDEGIPEGSRWHSVLLKGMARDIQEVRPAVIDDKTSIFLDEYRKFRHLARNIYTFNIIPDVTTSI